MRLCVRVSGGSWHGRSRIGRFAAHADGRNPFMEYVAAHAPGDAVYARPVPEDDEAAVVDVEVYPAIMLGGCFVENTIDIDVEVNGRVVIDGDEDDELVAAKRQLAAHYARVVNSMYGIGKQCDLFPTECAWCRDWDTRRKWRLWCV